MRYYFVFAIFFLGFSHIVNSQPKDNVLSETEFFIKAYSLAANESNDSLLKQYLVLYPKGDFVIKAKDNIDICAWQQARFKNTPESYQKYLQNFPQGKAAVLAKKNMNLLQDTMPKE